MANDVLSSPVRSILASASDRDGGNTERVSVTPRSFEDAIERAEADGHVPVIAEVKPTSPTADVVRNDDPVELARAMVAGGAAAISVLTEPDHFGGSLETLRRVRAAVDVPVLRKDFLLREAQLDAVSSDLVLLVARFVDDLPCLVEAAQSRGFEPLVEVHTRPELRAALATDATVIGINNRDLSSLTVDLGTFESVAADVPSRVAERRSTCTLVAESGIATPADVRRMRAAGADALLVGSAIMDGDVEANTRALVSAERPDAKSDGAVADGPEVDNP